MSRLPSSTPLRSVQSVAGSRPRYTPGSKTESQSCPHSISHSGGKTSLSKSGFRCRLFDREEKNTDLLRTLQRDVCRGSCGPAAARTHRLSRDARDRAGLGQVRLDSGNATLTGSPLSVEAQRALRGPLIERLQPDGGRGPGPKPPVRACLGGASPRGSGATGNYPNGHPPSPQLALPTQRHKRAPPEPG